MDVNKEVEKIAEELDTTPAELRIKVLAERYKYDCLDHQDYIFLLCLNRCSRQTKID